MKLIISGGTGLVGTELVRQALQLPQISTLVVLSRKPLTLPTDVDSGKLKQVLMKDYGEYPDDVRKEFVGAHACIWTVAITPAKSKTYDFAEVRRICHTCPLAGLQAMLDSEPAKPFKFLYMSGRGIQRDQTKEPYLMGPYRLLRGETETSVLEKAKNDPDSLQVAVAQPGLITSSVNTFRWLWGTTMRSTPFLFSTVTLEQISAAMLSEVVNGFSKETLANEDLERIGSEKLGAQKG